ncbi:hypothetical protein [Haloarcula amylovorans]|uniref:hypothetical protein n=1 Tax=Haloarcula amylovorans TaxID=2562280 RepID=UPI0010764780|nr:hypothetical protein [Halomicroarcula amylolytica]
MSESERFTNIPTPDRFFVSVGPKLDINHRPMDHEKEDIRFTGQNVPGGKFGFELAASYNHAGYDVNQHVCLDRDGAVALFDALANALGVEGDGASPRPGDLECRLCRQSWDPESLYRTGDVLRCPSCDGALRP